MLAMADSSGKVKCTVPGLSKISNVSVEAVSVALERLLAEDERSRTTDNDGRRIKAISDGWKILNFDKYQSGFLKESKQSETKSHGRLDDILVGAIANAWMARYKTGINDIRIRKELGSLYLEDRTLVAKAFKECIRNTPPQFFSWQKFVDSWRSWIETGEDPNEVFDRVVKCSAGYSPTGGTYWDQAKIAQVVGANAANAFASIGGTAKLRTLTEQNKKWIAMEFAKAFAQ
jgi:hypothetical protein